MSKWVLDRGNQDGAESTEGMAGRGKEDRVAELKVRVAYIGTKRRMMQHKAVVTNTTQCTSLRLGLVDDRLCAKTRSYRQLLLSNVRTQLGRLVSWTGGPTVGLVASGHCLGGPERVSQS